MCRDVHVIVGVATWGRVDRENSDLHATNTRCGQAERGRCDCVVAASARARTGPKNMRKVGHLLGGHPRLHPGALAAPGPPGGAHIGCSAWRTAASVAHGNVPRSPPRRDGGYSTLCSPAAPPAVASAPHSHARRRPAGPPLYVYRRTPAHKLTGLCERGVNGKQQVQPRPAAAIDQCVQKR